MKKALLIALVLGLLAFVAQYLWIYVFGTSTGLVFAPPRDPVLVTIDGGEAIRVPAGQVGQVELAQGARRIQLQVGGGSMEHTVTVLEAHVRIVLPALDPQCFVTLDLTNSHYQRPSQAGEQPPLPLVTKRHTQAEPFDLYPGLYFREQDLPDQAHEHLGVYLFRPAPCTLLGHRDEELLSALGYKAAAVR